MADKKRFSYVVGSLFWTGCFPFFPGTAASLATLLLGFFPLLIKRELSLFYPLSFLALSLLIGFKCVEKIIRETGDKDPKWVVIDEAAGLSIALILIPQEVLWYFAAFILFRFFDILKPYPINKLEKLRGAIGVFADDILAGLISAVLIQIAVRLI